MHTSNLKVGPFALWGAIGAFVQIVDVAWAISIIRNAKLGISSDTTNTESLSNALTIASYCTFVLSAYCFLRLVYLSKKFLSENGVALPEFSSTVLSFVVPFVNLYLPWKRLGVIRKSIAYYAKNREFELVEQGDSGIQPVAFMYIVAAVMGRYASSISVNTIDDYQRLIEVTGVAVATWCGSFLLSLVWLSGVARDFNGAVVAPVPRIDEIESTASSPLDEKREIVDEPPIVAKVAADLREPTTQKERVPRVHEGLRRLTIVVGAVWAAVTLIAVYSALESGGWTYDHATVVDALRIAGWSATVFGFTYYLIRLLAWVGKGFLGSSFRGPNRKPDLTGSIPLALGIVALVGGEVVKSGQESQRFVLEDPLADLGSSAPTPPVVQYAQMTITQAEFQAVKLGMTYEQAVAIIGEEGREYSAETVLGEKVISYSWDNGVGFGSATMTFRNNRLEEKRPFSLP